MSMRMELTHNNLLYLTRSEAAREARNLRFSLVYSPAKIAAPNPMNESKLVKFDSSRMRLSYTAWDKLVATPSLSLYNGFIFKTTTVTGKNNNLSSF